MLTSSVVLFHDDSRPHTAACTQALLDHLDHPSYSPYHAPSNYHLFTYMKNWIGSQSFNINELMEGVEMWLSSQVANFFDTGIQKLTPWYDKYQSSGSDYIEK
jgi:hypothetical protein